MGGRYGGREKCLLPDGNRSDGPLARRSVTVPTALFRFYLYICVHRHTHTHIRKLTCVCVCVCVNAARAYMPLPEFLFKFPVLSRCLQFSPATVCY